MNKRLKTIVHEFEHHFPFTILSVVIAILAIGIFTELMPRSAFEPASRIAEAAHDHAADTAPPPASDASATNAAVTDASAPKSRSPWERLFHLFHPMHILLSAAATTAMFWRYDRRLLMALFAGFVGALGFCGVSDIVFPWAGGWMMGTEMGLHICLIEHPQLVAPFAVIGVLAGLLAADAYSDRRISIFSHSAHVLISTGATILYLIGFGLDEWAYRLPEVFVIVFAAVIVPCCASDIFFPLLLTNPAGAHFCNGHCRDDLAGHDDLAGRKNTDDHA